MLHLHSAKRYFVLTIAVCLATLGAVAQNVVKGFVTDAATGERLSFVNVRVTRAGNAKAIVKGAATDDNGAFSIDALKDGNYDLTFSIVGYEAAQRTVSLSKAQRTTDLGNVGLKQMDATIGEVTVTGERSTMKLEVDRKSYNIGADLANAGVSASEALENIPSVEVDHDGNISMRGSSSVEVWINGKPSGLTAENRAMILQQLPAETIDRIEVIDNPSAKYSAEGSAGIINIVLKHDRKGGYFGSVQVGGNTAGGANTSANINYNSKLVDINATVGYRHRQDHSGSLIEQTFLDSKGNPISYQNSRTEGNNNGNNLFSRAGITLHASKKDDISLNGNMMLGRGTDESDTPYYYGNLLTDGTKVPTQTLWRNSFSKRPMRMLNAELDYRHSFTEKHFINLNVTRGQWKSDMGSTYTDATIEGLCEANPFPIGGSLPLLSRSYQRTEQNVNNLWTAVKLDYENTFNDHWQLQAGYNGDFHREDTPQRMFTDPTSYDGQHEVADEGYYNRFIYDYDVHALYATTTMKYGKWGAMAGLRGEYWTTHSLSYTFGQDPKNDLLTAPLLPAPDAIDRSHFQLFPSLFLSYQLTPNDQLQINYTRRLRRPWGGELNPFIDTRSASNLNFGNPDLTPEFSNAFSLNYLRTWLDGAHSLLLSAFYRPTTDVMQRLSYRLPADARDENHNLINEQRVLTTSQNVTQSTSTGGELTLKDRFGQMFDLNTTLSAYYYHLNAFDGLITDPLYNQTVPVSVAEQNRFTWSLRMQGNLRLPKDWSIQATGNYRSREAVSQGSRDPAYGLDLGVRKMFLGRKLILAFNCRDVLNSRRWTQNAFTDSFTQHGEFWRHSRKVGVTLTWNFGNMQRKMRPDQMRQQNQQMGGDDPSYGGGYGVDMGD